MTRREQAYNRKVQELIDRAGHLRQQEVKRARALLETARKEIATAVADTEWQAHRLHELTNAVEQAFEGFKQRYDSDLSAALANSFEAGIDMVDMPLAAAGIKIAAAELSLTELEIMQGYSTSLVKGLSADAVKKINSELTLGLLGRKTPFEVMTAIGRNLDDKSVMSSISARAQTITRTEMARVHSASREARIQALAEGQTDPPVEWKKKWISSSRLHPRLNHAMLDGVMVGIEEDFPGGIPYPHAPGLPAAEVINCGCTHVAAADWDKIAEDYGRQIDPVPVEERAA